jgi:hypothetical protein
MSGKLIELPRRLEWKPIETWIGRVKGTGLCTKVSEKLEGAGFVWEAWSGCSLVAAGEAPDMLAGRKAAEEALESGVVVVRPLPSSNKGVP